jgi:hypothetical protein
MTAELRRKIYTKKTDKEYWGKVCEWKEEKIRDITERNYMPNIFDDKELRKEYNNKYYPSTQVPLLLACKKDLVYYFNPKAEVLVHNGIGIRQGTIVDADFDTNRAEVNMADTQSIENHPLTIVRRVV